MKNKGLILLTLIVTVSSQLYAQELFESLGGVKTNFELYSDSVDLEVKTQFIIKNTETKNEFLSSGNYGYAYDSFHLEFVTDKGLKTKYHDSPSYCLRMIFYNSNNEILADKELIRNEIRITYVGGKELSFYSINLIDIPISLLSYTTKIDIAYLEYKSENRRQ